jgi:NAD(P)H-nitrite reductase large subunit
MVFKKTNDWCYLFGDTNDGSRLLNLIVEKKDIPDNEKMSLKLSDKENSHIHGP